MIAMHAGRLVHSLQGGACYEEVHDLWQRVTKAEQAASEATSELREHKHAARQAVLELKVRHCCMYLLRGITCCTDYFELVLKSYLCNNPMIPHAVLGFCLTSLP